MGELTELKRTCTTCVLCLRDDYGYSNVTVEGTSLSCLAGLNPALDGQDEPYRDVTPELAAALDVALECPRYRVGAPATLDVDREGLSVYDSAMRKYSQVTPDVLKGRGATDDDEAAELLAIDQFNWVKP